MRANWRQVKRKPGAGQWLAIYVTLNPKGVISVGKVAYTKLGEPKAVEIFFDEINNRIGIKSSHSESKNTFKMTAQGKWGGHRIHAYILMQEYRIKLSQTVQFFDAEFDEDGILVLDLRTARVPKRVENHERNRKTKVTAESIT